MSLVTDVTKSTIKITGNDHTVTEDLVGENLFVEVKRSFQLKAKVEIVDRTTIIGDYLPVDPPLLFSRKVDIFRNTTEMLLKSQQYASGAIPGKTVDDAVGILAQYIYLSDDDCIEPAIVLSDLFVRGLIVPNLFEESFFAIDYAFRKHSTNLVLRKHVENVWLSLYAQIGKGDSRAAELMQVGQKITQKNLADTPFWNQDYAAFMVNVIEKITLHEGMNLEVALRVVKEDYKRSPQDAQKKLALVSLYLAQTIRFFNKNQFQRAIEFSEKALKVDPDKQQTKILLAKCLNELSVQYLTARKADQYKEVIVAQERAIQLNPDFGRAYHNLAVALWLENSEQPDLERIIGLFEKNLSLSPDDPLSKSELARAYDSLSGLYLQGKKSGKSEIDALELMAKAIVLTPADVSVQSGFVVVSSLVALKCLQGQLPGKSVEDGELYLTKGIEFQDKDLLPQGKELLASACNQYAVAFTNGLIANKSHMDSIALLERAVELNPSFDQAKENLFFVYGQYIEMCVSEFNKGENLAYYATQAIQILEKAVVLRPDDLDCRVLLSMFKKQCL